jgi:H/ACA ribonucleoprotein complex non-core subunit NAF1
LGRVQQPYYSVRFTNAAAITEAGIVKGTKIFYVEPHSTYVFTQPLKAFKGSDASNLHDEEVGEDEISFRMTRQKQSTRDELNRDDRLGRMLDSERMADLYQANATLVTELIARERYVNEL